MKRWATVLAAGVLAFSIYAQVGPALGAEKPPAPSAAKGKRVDGLKRVEEALAKLNLTAAQKPKIADAIKLTKEDLKKVRESPGAPEEKRPKFRAVQKSLQTRLEVILTTEQENKLKDLLGVKRTKPAAPVK